MNKKELPSGRRIDNVFEILGPLVDGKRVLDVGCIGHNFQHRKKIGTFYQDELSSRAAFCQGLDILEHSVNEARAAGYNVVLGNAETYSEPDFYDCIFAGELIEHLSNPGQFLDHARVNLVDDGVLVLTTPNTFSWSRLIRVLGRLTNEPPQNPEHTCYFTPLTLGELCTRHGFKIAALYYSDYDYGKVRRGAFRSISLKLNSWLSVLVPRLSQSFVFVLKKSANSA